MDNRFKFEVRRNDKVIFHCEEKECVPPKEVQQSILNAGYTIFINGKKKGT